jgi:hypothetical protein
MYDPHDKNFETHFLRTVGDLKTNNRIISVQNIRLETSNENFLPYDRLQWVIPNMVTWGYFIPSAADPPCIRDPRQSALQDR